MFMKMNKNPSIGASYVLQLSQHGDTEIINFYVDVT